MAERKSPEDLDRELIELLNELRVTLPGVQVLFAFLAGGMVAAVFLVFDVVFGIVETAVVSSILAGIFVWFWFGLPLWRRVERDR